MARVSEISASDGHPVIEQMLAQEVELTAAMALEKLSQPVQSAGTRRIVPVAATMTC